MIESLIPAIALFGSGAIVGGGVMAIRLGAGAKKQADLIDDLEFANLSAKLRIKLLQNQLAKASANDHRDSKGRFTKAPTVMQ